MTPPKKNPTNGDIYKEIKEVRAMQASQGTRIATLEFWKLQEDAYKAAIMQVHKEQQQENSGKDERLLNKKLMNALMIALGAIVSLVAIVQAAK